MTSLFKLNYNLNLIANFSFTQSTTLLFHMSTKLFNILSKEKTTLFNRFSIVIVRF